MTDRHRSMTHDGNAVVVTEDGERWDAIREPDGRWNVSSAEHGDWRLEASSGLDAISQARYRERMAGRDRAWNEEVGGVQRQEGRIMEANTWVCESCGHQWAETRPEGDDPERCESCRHPFLRGFPHRIVGNVEAADEFSENVRDRQAEVQAP